MADKQDTETPKALNNHVATKSAELAELNIRIKELVRAKRQGYIAAHLRYRVDRRIAYLEGRVIDIVTRGNDLGLERLDSDTDGTVTPPEAPHD